MAIPKNERAQHTYTLKTTTKTPPPKTHLKNNKPNTTQQLQQK